MKYTQDKHRGHCVSLSTFLNVDSSVKMGKFPVMMRCCFADMRYIKFLISFPKVNYVLPENVEYWNKTAHYHENKYYPFQPSSWSVMKPSKNTPPTSRSVSGLALWPLMWLNYHNTPWMKIILSEKNPSKIQFPPDAETVLSMMAKIDGFSEVPKKYWKLIAEYIFYYLVTWRHIIIDANFEHNPNLLESFKPGKTSIDWCYNRKDKFAQCFNGYVLTGVYKPSLKTFLGVKLSIHVKYKINI